MEIKNKNFFRKHRNKFSFVGNSILKYIEISIVLSILQTTLAYSNSNWITENAIILIISLMFACIIFVDIDKFFEGNNINNIFYQIITCILILFIFNSFVFFISDIITEFDISTNNI